MKKIYLCSGFGFASILSISVLAGGIVMFSPEIFMGTFCASLVGAFGSIYVFNKTQAIYKHSTIEHEGRNVDILVPMYHPSKYISAAILGLSLGLMISPICVIVGHPIVIEAAGISVAVVAGSSLYAMFAKPGSLSVYRSAIYGALMGLVGVGATSLLASVLGFPNVALLAHQIDLYAGICLFTIINAIDTHVAIDMYKQNKPDHLECSVGITLTMMNLFSRIAELLKLIKK